MLIDILITSHDVSSKNFHYYTALNRLIGEMSLLQPASQFVNISLHKIETFMYLTQHYPIYRELIQIST